MNQFEITFHIILADEPEYSADEIIDKMADVCFQLGAEEVANQAPKELP